MSDVSTAAVAEFRASFGGTAMQADDEGYDTARAVWNGSIDRHPALIARCSSAQDVAAATRDLERHRCARSGRLNGACFSRCVIYRAQRRNSRPFWGRGLRQN